MRPPYNNEIVDIGDWFAWNLPGAPKAGDYTYVPYSKRHKGIISFTNPKDKRGRYTRGMFWWSAKEYEERTPSRTVTIYRPNSAGLKYYTGSLTSSRESLLWTTCPYDWANNSTQNINQLNAWGSTIIAQTRPDLPDFSFANSFYELREVPGLLRDSVNGVRRQMADWQRQRRFLSQRQGGRSGLSRTAQFHLALQFGWLPILSDVRQFTHAFMGKDKRLQQLIRDEGKVVRRKRDFGNMPLAPSQYSTYTHSGAWGSAMNTTFVTQAYGQGKATSSCRVDETRHVWGVVAYTYLLPPGPHNAAWMAPIYRKIMGMSVTPDVVYNAMPWSWLADYFVNLGDFVKATGPGLAQNLYIKYGFTMQHIMWRVQSDSSVSVIVSPDGRYENVHAQHEQRREIKTRGNCTPFGFGVKQNQLTTKQIGILGALGFSRLP